VRRFVLIGQTASATSAFSLEDLPSSSGRLDVLLRALRAALLFSHGLRREVLVYLILRGGTDGSRLLRVDGRRAKFIRPDERSLAILVRKTLAAASTPSDAYVELRPGLALRSGDLAEVLAETSGAPCFVLDEAGHDLRGQRFADDDAWFFIGDHLGFDPVSSALLERHGCERVSVGPVSVHSEDVVALVHNELDRRFAPS